MITTQIEDIQQAFQTASRFPAPIGEETFFAFRGHSNVNYNLAPSLSRIIHGNISCERIAYELETRLTFEFRRRSRHLRPKATSGMFRGADGDRSTEDLWQKMQHHGAPTRLLDWTRSFYVALYFAVVGSPESDGEILVIDTSAIAKWSDTKPDQKPPLFGAAFCFE